MPDIYAKHIEKRIKELHERMNKYLRSTRKRKSKEDMYKTPEEGYQAKVKEINSFLEKNKKNKYEKNGNKVLESRSNLYVEEREQLIPHKPKYSGTDNYSL